MKKIISVVAAVSLFLSSAAFAGGWGGKTQFFAGGWGGFNANAIGTSEASGVGTVQQSQSYAINEQVGVLQVETMKTVYGQGSPCQGTCDENVVSGGFRLLQNVSAGAKNQAEGGDYAASAANSNIQGSFDFGKTFKGFAE